MNKGFAKIILLFLFVLPFSLVYGQQDAQFSQYMFNGLYINPAYAGYRENWNMNMFYRNQWSGLPGAPVTFSAAADGTLNNKRVGLGLQVMNDQIGAQNNTSLFASYAYRIPVNEDGSKTFSIGISGGFTQQGLKLDVLNPSSSGDPLLMNAKNTAFLPDAKVGIFYNSDRYYVGLSADNLLTSEFQRSDLLKTYLPLKPHMYFTTGLLLPLSGGLILKPSVLVKEDFAGPTSVDLNAFLLIEEKLWIGGSYRTAVLNKSEIDKNLTKAGAAVAMIEYFVSEKLRLGYAYDQTINSTVANGYTTHEVSISYIFTSPKGRMLSPRYF